MTQKEIPQESSLNFEEEKKMFKPTHKDVSTETYFQRTRPGIKVRGN